jgi:hypothetical protein
VHLLNVEVCKEKTALLQTSDRKGQVTFLFIILYVCVCVRVFYRESERGVSMSGIGSVMAGQPSDCCVILYSSPDVWGPPTPVRRVHGTLPVV